MERSEQEWMDEIGADDDGGVLAPGWKDWLHGVFLEQGPIPSGEVWDLALAVKLDRARSACPLVTADLVATTGTNPGIDAVVDHERVRIKVGGNLASVTGLIAITKEELVVEVADTVQDEVMEDQWGV